MNETYSKTLFIVEGILLMILGIVAIAVPQIFTMGLELLLGWILVFSGIFQLIRAFAGKTDGFFPALLGAILAGGLGALLLCYPITGLISLTILIAIFFLIEGISKISFGFQLKPMRNWGWLVFSGVLAIILSGIIWFGLPETAIWVIGLLFGINLLFVGLALLSIGISMKSAE